MLVQPYVQPRDIFDAQENDATRSAGYRSKNQYFEAIGLPMYVYRLQHP
jgi:hypothetical protein